jgi:RNA polymerase sigma-70 factor, ECF subfamily
MSFDISIADLDAAQLTESNDLPGDPRPKADASDLSLARLAQAGHRGAFDLLVLKYQTKVLSVARRYARHPQMAEDIAQEALIRAYRGLQQFRGESTFYTWLYRITVNAARGELAARQHDRPMVSLETARGSDLDETALHLTDANTPELAAVADAIRDAVNAALEGLPAGQRRAIALREIEGLSYEEIAVATGTPLGTVRSRIFRARESIDKHLRSVDRISPEPPTALGGN